MENIREQLTKILIPFCAIAIMGFGCAEEDLLPAPVEVRFELLNEAGVPSSTFKEGEDIVFRYSIVNNSGNSIIITNFQEVLGNDFMLVLESYQRDDGSMTKNSIGFPYDGIKIIDVFGLELEAYDTLVMQASWKGELENTEYVEGFDIGYKSNRGSLTLGKYIVEFEHTISFAQYGNKHVRIKENFEVI